MKQPAIIEVSGTSEEMGEMHGRLLGEHVRTGVNSYLDRLMHQLKSSADSILQLVRETEPFVPKAYRQELAALAETAGVSYERLLIYNCLPDLSNHLERELAQCTNFVVFGPATSGSVMIHGRNLDFFHLNTIHQCACIVIRKPQYCVLGTVSIGWAGFIGTLTGSNSAGLTAGEVSALAKDSALAGMPIGMLMRDCLESSAKLDTFLRRVKEAPRTSGFNIAVSSEKENRCAGIEFTHSLCRCREPLNGVLVVDDPCLCARTANNRIGYAWGVFRYARMMQLIGGAYGAIDANRALEFLRDKCDAATLNPVANNNRCICNPNTVQSVLFLPSQKKLLVAHGTIPAPDGPYAALDLQGFQQSQMTGERLAF